ncbi:MAG TPA: phosphodiester glycosidase family protein [Gemmatimonadales bacterium]|nr:phosphodiester glycosidase family protein [Gemmatimonadales bacterium]
MSNSNTPARLLTLALFLGACAGSSTLSPEPAPAGFSTTVVTRIADGVTHSSLRAPGGPWAVEVLEVEIDTCTTLRAVKGFAGAVGRERTSVLLQRLDDTVKVLGGVNADFFLFAPPGRPTNAHISGHRVVTGPSAQPVFALSRFRHPYIGTLSIRGQARIGDRQFLLGGWNRVATGGLALFDRSYGAMTDTASSVIEVLLGAEGTRRVVAVDTTWRGMAIPPGHVVLVAGASAPADVRQAMLSLRPGDPVEVEARIEPIHPEEAVGGRPVLVTDSAITLAARDTNAFSVTRHPRTAVGVSGDGGRIWLVTVDGRQPGYSVGMSLLELAALMRDIGAVEAINLDGGGSTALVLRDPASGVLSVANRPSDVEGERAVGNALAVVQKCENRVLSPET